MIAQATHPVGISTREGGAHTGWVLSLSLTEGHHHTGGAAEQREAPCHHASDVVDL